ncbi:MerR family transcriptional regulator [Isoptericola croceus]|uniref:MerR family transcriptional regulator n=1 Tax=Isoptericola croceus TaxID=3031406 RepID=UPI0023F95E96|nr:MerR family transcriptional regulator [Isoptericola croceus]
MLISELAGRSGVKVSTVRYYERRELLPDPRADSDGYRWYTDEDVRRIRFLRRGQELGFRLGELAVLVEMSDDARSRALVTPEIRARAREKLAEIDERIADLRRMRTALDDVLSARDVDPAVPCPIVGALA